MIVVDAKSAVLLYAEPEPAGSAELEPEKGFAVLDRRAAAQDLQGAFRSAELAPRKSSSKGSLRARLASLGSKIGSVLGHEMVLEPLLLLVLLSLPIGGIIWVGSSVGAQQREILSEGTASIMATAVGESIDEKSQGLPGSTELSGSFGASAAEISLKDPATGETLRKVEVLGTDGYSYTVDGTLKDYSISFRKNGSDADGKSYRYDSRTEKIKEVTEKDLWQ